MKKNTWNVWHLVDESFVPWTRQTSILHCRLSDFWGLGMNGSRTSPDFIKNRSKTYSHLKLKTTYYHNMALHFLPKIHHRFSYRYSKKNWWKDAKKRLKKHEKAHYIFFLFFCVNLNIKIVHGHSIIVKKWSGVYSYFGYGGWYWL